MIKLLKIIVRPCSLKKIFSVQIFPLQTISTLQYLHHCNGYP